jgi:hypothetical protein
VPKERYSTIVIRELDNWQEQIGEILFRGRDIVVKTQEMWPELGVIRTIKHDADWETRLLMSLAGGE